MKISLRCLIPAMLLASFACAYAQVPNTQAAAAQTSKWADHGEYDLALAVRGETAPAARLEKLNQWKEKYPNSALREARQELFLAAYRDQGDTGKMLSVAEELAATDPGNVVGLYWTALLVPSLSAADGPTVELAAKAARDLITNREKYFLSATPPDGVTATDWAKGAEKYEFVAHRALGWTNWKSKDFAAAETELTSALKLMPDDTQVETWLATVQTLEGTPKSQSAAVWHLLRATSAQGDRALPGSEKAQFSTAAERLYTTLKGDSNGYEILKSSADAAPFPPETFVISPLDGASDTDAAANAAIWSRLRMRLMGPDGSKYFESELKGKPVPLFRGKVVRCTPPNRPKEVALAMSDDMQEDIVLTLSTPLAGPAKPGTEVEFLGTADSLTAAPFRLALTTDPQAVTGWPGASSRSGLRTPKAAH